MRTLLIPCAGERRIIGIPLILLRHPKDGRYLFDWVVDGVFPHTYDRIIYVIRDETNEKYDAKNLILSTMSHRFSDTSVEVLVLDEPTYGSAETVYVAIEKCEIKGEIAIKDSHAYTLLKEDCSGNFVSSLDLTKNLYNISDLRTKSFIVSNEQGQILDVIEKRFRSDVISAGLYGLKDTADFINAYERLSDGTYPITKLYVSHIISYLIGYKERIFRSYEVELFEEWGSNSIWSALQRQYANYYLDMTSLFGDKMTLSDIVVNQLKERSSKGAAFIAIVGDTNCDRDIQKELNEAGVNCIATISGCNKSSENIFIREFMDLETRGL